MATSIFELFGTIMVDNTAANKSISATDSKASKLAKSLGNGIKTAAKFGAGLAAGAGIAVAGMTKLASSSAEAMDEIDKGSQKMGISAKAYQEWNHVMELSGMEISTMKTGMRTLQQAMSGVNEEGEDTTAEFEALGISVRDADGNMRSTEDVMNETIAALASMEDGAERTALATKLFGRAGTEMAPLLNAGTDSIEAMKQEAHDLGLVFSDDTVKAGAKLNDTMTNVKKSFEALKVNLGNALMPVVQQFAEALLKFMPKIQQLFDRLAPVLTRLFDKLMPIFLELVDKILPVLFDILDMLMPIFEDLCDMVLPILVDMLDMIAPLLRLVSELLKPILDLVNMLLKPILDFIHWIFGGITDGLNDVTGALDGEGGLAGGLGSVSSLLFGDFSEGFELFGNILTEAVSLVGDAFKGIVNFLSDPKQALSDFFDWAQEKLHTLWDSLKSIGEGIEYVLFEKPAADAQIAKNKESIAAARAEKEAEGWHFVDMGNGSTQVMNAEQYAEYARKQGIPGYANGGVFAPNKPFLALLGDQKQGTNVEAPLETIEQAVANVIGKTTIKHEGTIRIEGVNNQGEFIGAADYVVGGLVDELRRESRLAYG